jgi:hypothetical protein
MYSYLGLTLSYKTGKYVTNKLTKYLEMRGFIKQVLKCSNSKSKPEYAYTTLAVPTLLDGSESLKGTPYVTAKEIRIF